MASYSLKRLLSQRRGSTTERSLISYVEMRSLHGQLLYWAAFTFLIGVALCVLFPFYWMIIGALKTPSEILQIPPVFWPQDPQWGNFVLAWSRLRYTLYFANTLGIALGGWLLLMFVSTTAAFALSKLKPAGRYVLLFFFFATIMVPSSTLLIPRYLTVVNVPLLNINLTNTWWAIWLPGAVNGFTIFLLTTFFDQIPNDLIDSARIDGANAWRIFTRIVLPLSKPALVVVSVFAILASWTDFFWPFLVLKDSDKQPIMTALYTLATSSDSTRQNTLSLVFAGLLIASLPPLVLFAVFQRHIIRGINFTGLQG